MLMKKVLSVALLAGASTMFFASPALAAAEVADQTQSIAGTTGNGLYCSSDTPSPGDELEEGSNFTAGVSGQLTSFDLPINFTFTPGDMVASLYETTDSLPTGAALATQTVASASLVGLVASPLHVTFTSPAIVTAGHTYAFTLKFAACGGGLQQIDYYIGDATADKQIATYVDGAWTTQTLLGIAFTTYVTPVDAPTLSNTGASNALPATVVAGVGLMFLGALVLSGIQLNAVRRRR